jgi:hypothetical protein
MSLWAQKKQALYALIVILFLIVVAGIPVYYVFFHKVASCSDGIQNQGEDGVDCGGPCSKVCPYQAQPPIVHWQQFFKVVDGTYSVVANVENPNAGVYAENVPYVFQLFDNQGVVIAERSGTTFMLPNTIFPIFESNLITGQRTPVRASFAFGPIPQWQKKPYQLANLVIIDQTLTEATSTGERVDATVQNQEDYQVTNAEIVAVAYDTDGNAVAASHTTIDTLGPQAQTHIVFTWPQLFGTTISKILLTPKVYPRFNF